MGQQRHWELSGIKDERVIQAMGRVPRHLFVPEEQSEFAYEDRALPIEHGQTISQPFVVAAMTEALGVGKDARVLEVGGGSGYQAAVLAEIVQHVYSIEIDPRLAEQARQRLEELGYHNVSMRSGDGYAGWVEEAPFDAIIVAAAAEDIPPPLMDQLKDGGRLVIPLGTPGGAQELFVVEKDGATVTTKSLMAVRFVPFRRSVEQE